MLTIVGPYEFWGQVGNGEEDHKMWTRATDIDDENRPCYQINATHPGSDLAGEVAAALAASSLVFFNVDRAYYTKLVKHAEELYNFANMYRGMYSDAIPDAAKFYKSWSGYDDELAWAAAWLFKTTGNQKYLTDAETHWKSMDVNAQEFSWDNKGRGVAVLLAELTAKSTYVDNAKGFCNWLITSAPKTPQGMIFLQQWGSNRHAANVAFICLSLSKNIPSLDFIDFARTQIHLLLGDAGRSYVVGFGNNPPVQPHHSGSSCPARPAVCDWDDFRTDAPNPNVLNGALVGGPDARGRYVDRRTDFIKNEVAVDYNAGFQSATVGLAYLQSRGKC